MSLFARRQPEHERYGDRLPPGQKLTEGWPVLHYGGIPNVDLASWRFEIAGLVEEPVSFTWEDFMALPQASLTNDIHCVTTWSKFDNVWTGVPVAEVLKRARPKPEAKHAMVHSYGGYTTNLSLDDLNREGNLFAHTHNGQPLTKEHGWPLRLVVPHLYFWKSAKWVRQLHFMEHDKAGFWEAFGYHNYGDPWREQRYTGDL